MGTQIIDDTPHACWYRLLDDGQLEVWARGHHVVVPVETLALLPESIARAVLSKLAQGDEQAAIELNLLSQKRFDAN